MHAHKLSVVDREGLRSRSGERTDQRVHLPEVGDEHPLAAAKGLMIAVALSAPIWALIYLLLR
jgi:hypothetical protein